MPNQSPLHSTWLLAALGFASLVGCGTSDPSSLDVARDELEGTWVSPCFPTSATESAQTRIAYANLNLSGTYLEYSDTSCTTGRHTTTWTGAAAGGEEVAPDVRAIDLTFASFRSTPLTQAEADLVNGYQYCGITDWMPGVERDVMGKDCANFSIPDGGKSLDIYQRDEATLRFGKGAKIGVTLTEADRPTALDETTFTQ